MLDAGLEVFSEVAITPHYQTTTTYSITISTLATLATKLQDTQNLKPFLFQQSLGSL